MNASIFFNVDWDEARDCKQFVYFCKAFHIISFQKKKTSKLFRYVAIKNEKVDKLKPLIEQAIATDEHLTKIKTGSVRVFKMFDKYTNQISDTLVSILVATLVVRVAMTIDNFVLSKM